ncbi:hypothetical protein AAFF_G00289890 [Aldrovandia affinis]|uniref:Uncharacterized protein n=1 Tax=Aldrovandia affinis TaxID=143900 RepID=A0AAD7R9J0_9TELE|nr:hypothetical protein AAFF_G00289890 [Aldrovandia affinis]
MTWRPPPPLRSRCPCQIDGIDLLLLLLLLLRDRKCPGGAMAVTHRGHTGSSKLSVGPHHTPAELQSLPTVPLWQWCPPATSPRAASDLSPPTATQAHAPMPTLLASVSRTNGRERSGVGAQGLLSVRF